MVGFTVSRKICYITGTRADFGLMQSTLRAIHQSDDLELSIIVTGMHLAEQYGNTVDEIVAAGLPVTARVAVDSTSTTGASMARNIGTMLIGFVDALLEIRPDLVLLLGDRGEMLAGALAALHLNIHVAHIHGGERSGTVDEPVRHAISKLSHFHLAATNDARDRLIRMGEQIERVYVTGAPGLDGLQNLVCMTREALLATYRLDLCAPVALLVYHPVLQEAEFAGDGMHQVLDVLHAEGVQVLALMPNSDAGSDQIRSVLETRKNDPGIRVVTHFPRNQFVSWMASVDLMIGNSSAGIIEAASFGTPVVNIGNRQNLRERNSNVIDAPVKAVAIESAIRRALAHGRYERQNVFGDGHSSLRILKVLQGLSLEASVLAKANVY